MLQCFFSFCSLIGQSEPCDGSITNLQFFISILLETYCVHKFTYCVHKRSSTHKHRTLVCLIFYLHQLFVKLDLNLILIILLCVIIHVIPITRFKMKLETLSNDKLEGVFRPPFSVRNIKTKYNFL